MTCKFEIQPNTDEAQQKTYRVVPEVRIVLVGDHTSINNKVTLSASLSTDEEIDEAIDRLIGELNKTRKKAKASLEQLR